MIGSIIGDIAGSRYEFSENKNIKAPILTPDSKFTDDTVLAVATADAILHDRDFAECYREYGHRFPSPVGGYGLGFLSWLGADDPKPYYSWGNGSAMRVSPIGWAYESLDETVRKAEQSAAVTHNHPEGIKGACATAAAIWLSRTGATKPDIKAHIAKTYGYDLNRTCDSIRPDYHFEASCQRTVPEAIIAFLDSTNFEEAIRLAISLGGDADTLACITGGIAQAFYKDIPDYLVEGMEQRIPPSLGKIIDEFDGRFSPEY